MLYEYINAQNVKVFCQAQATIELLEILSH